MGEKHSKEERFTPQSSKYYIRHEDKYQKAELPHEFEGFGGETSQSIENLKSTDSHFIESSDFYDNHLFQEDSVEKIQNEPFTYKQSIGRSQFGEYAQPIKIRVENIINYSKELKSLFTRDITSILKKIKLLRTLLDSIEMEYIIIDNYDKKTSIDENEFIVDSNFFIILAIRKILSSKNSLLYTIDDPFFKIIPSITWNQLENHMNNIIAIQSLTSDAFRSSEKLSVNISEDNFEDAYNYFLETLNEISSLETEILKSFEIILDKKKEIDQLLSSIESTSIMNCIRLKKYVKRLKDNLRDLMGINEQAVDIYPELPAEFSELTSAMVKAEDARLVLKKYIDDIKSFIESIKTLKHHHHNVKHESRLNSSLPLPISRTKNIIQNLYILVNLLTPNLFLMDKDKSSFEKIKESVNKLNLTSLFDNISTEYDAKIVLVKYILETFISTNELLDSHKLDNRGVESSASKDYFEDLYDKKDILDDLIIDINEMINHSNVILSEIENDFDEINKIC